MQSRAYTTLKVRSVNEDERVIEGIASSPAPDRHGDVVESTGAKFSLPMPLLWQHRHDSPVGHVEFAEAGEDGIRFRARVAKIDEDGELRAMVDKAWQSVKSGLVRGVSIGFKAIEYSFMDEGGVRFIEWEWLELSLVTIPANAEATIQAIKTADTQIRAASGRNGDEGDRRDKPGAAGIIVQIKPKSREAQVNITEQIKDLEATRQAKAARRQEIQKAAADEGRTKDDAEREEFETITDEIKAIDRELKDLRELEKDAVAQAKPVDNTPTQKAASDSRDSRVIVHAPPKLDKGIEFARFAMCVAAAKGDPGMALNLAQSHYPQQGNVISVLKAARDSGRSVARYIAGLAETRTKADVPAGTTTDETWAKPLVAHETYTADFIEFLRPRTIIGRFGTGGVPSLRQIPFNVHIKGQSSGGSGYWVGEGKAKPVTKFGFLDTYHGFTKVAALSVLTEELIRFSDPSAERLVRDSLADALIARLDSDFVNPAITAVAGQRPASITNGVTAIEATGDPVLDIMSLWANADSTDLPVDSAVYITSAAIARRLVTMRHEVTGNRLYPDMTMTGGSIDGVPTIVSNHVPSGLFILTFASEIYFSDDGTVTVDASREASIEMADNPSGDSDTPAGAELVSMYQTDSIALRAHRYVHWSKRRTNAVQLLEDVDWPVYGGGGTEEEEDPGDV